MKQRKKGRFVFVTSARYLQPEPGFSLATSIRAGTAAFALALAKEVASYGIQVNVWHQTIYIVKPIILARILSMTPKAENKFKRKYRWGAWVILKK